MARFASEQEFYDCLGGLFLELLEDDEIAARFRRAGIVFQYRCHDPSALITLKLLPDEPVQVDLGETSLEPHVVMKMSADTAHEFYLGRVNASVALARRQITATGAVPKALRLARLIKPIVPRYRARLERAGRLDLLA
jgi:SCP-2 sterol transfer family